VIYLDYQATTPLAPEAREAMLPWLDQFGNPHSPHRFGREAAAAIAVARGEIVETLLPSSTPADEEDDPGSDMPGPEDDARWDARAESGRLIFTSGATEAINWAMIGGLAAAGPGRTRIVTTAIEHSAVLETARFLAGGGAELVVAPVDATGRADMDAMIEAIDERTAFVVLARFNNEIGVSQALLPISARARAVGAMLICDDAQGFGKSGAPLALCDMIAISAHKIYGPKGIGALWLRNGIDLPPLIHGGGQEYGLRSGTLSPALCAGFGAAATLARARRDEDLEHVSALNRRLIARLGDGWVVNGWGAPRYRGNLNIRRDGVDANRLISDVRGVAFSAGSACASGSGRPSHVLRAIGLSEAQARSSIRLGFGRYTAEAEIDEAAALINAAVERQLEWA
jgi:cysteine desulfurase